MGSDPSIPWFVALLVIVVANLVLAAATQRRLKKVSPEGWSKAGSWSLFANNSFQSTVGFMRFVYGRECYGDAQLHKLKWGVRLCHLLGAVLFVNLLLLFGTVRVLYAG